MAEQRSGPGPTGGAGEGRRGARPGPDPLRPDLDGVRATRSDPGALPVPRSVLESKGIKPPPPAGAPYDLERGLLPGARRPIRPPPRRVPTGGPSSPREAEAALRRRIARAALTPEEVGRALSRLGDAGVRDPQRGREAGPPLPGEPGYRGEG